MTRSTVRPSRSWVLPLAIAFLAGCGGPSPTRAPATQAPTGPSATAAAARTRVGAIDQVLSTNARVDAADAFESQPIFASSDVSTDPSGAVAFDIPGRIKSCTVMASSEVTVEPSSDVVVHFAAGSTICQTVKSSGLIMLDAEHDVQLSMTDPSLIVTVAPDATTVQVVRGLVSVSGGGGGPVYLGPGFQTEVADGGAPSSAFSFDRSQLAPDIAARLEQMLNAEPTPGFGRPDPAGSTTLATIFERGSFLVGIDDRVVSDQPSNAFVQEFVAFEGAHWDVGVDSVHLSYEAGLSALAEGKIALFVSPAPTTADQTAIPFFTGPSTSVGPALPIGPVDLYTPADDPVFAEAERSLLLALVGSDDTQFSYRVFYRGAFGQDPDYASLADLFGLR